MILPDDLSFHKMNARNAGNEAFDLDGSGQQAVKVVLSVSGVPELVWKNEYWYTADGEYLGFRGRRAGLLSPSGSLILRSKRIEP